MKKNPASPRRAASAIAAVFSTASLAFLSACAANPGPPPVVEDNASALQEDQTTTTATPEEEQPQDADSAKRPTISVGVDLSLIHI